MGRLKRRFLLHLLTTDLQMLIIENAGVLLLIVIPILFKVGVLRLHWSESEQMPWGLQIVYMVGALLFVIVLLGTSFFLAMRLSNWAVHNFQAEAQYLFWSFCQRLHLRPSMEEGERQEEWMDK
ncbi:MAG: hypothetical protein C4583_11355 [Anaerolineaceae bacterium]|nr:MAG: hypothetical protein C4583_11355 [Anaerolineaceae bacterium]